MPISPSKSMCVGHRFCPAKLIISGFVFPGGRNPVIIGPPQLWLLKRQFFSDHFRRRNSGGPESRPFFAHRCRGPLKCHFPLENPCGSANDFALPNWPFWLRTSGARNPVISGPPQSRVLKTSTFSEHSRCRNSGVPKSSPFPARRSCCSLKRLSPLGSSCVAVSDFAPAKLVIFRRCS